MIRHPRRDPRTAPLRAFQPRPFTLEEITKMRLQEETDAAMAEVRRLRDALEKSDDAVKFGELVAAYARVQATLDARIDAIQRSRDEDRAAFRTSL